jgi:hypothetical protein
MSVFSDYTAEGQQLLLNSLEAAGIAISTASLESSAETASEGFAAASYVLNSRERYLDNTLVGSVQYELAHRAETGHAFPDYVDLATRPGANEWAYETLKNLAILLENKSTRTEAAGYKDWLLNIAAATTQAGKEDPGFLGWGSVWVNDAEVAAMKKIAATLGVEYTPPANK